MTAVLGLSLVTAGTAAASTGTWRAYGNTNPIAANWQCGRTADLATGIKAQACALRSNDGLSIQAAVIVRNNRSSVHRTSAEPRMFYSSSGAFFESWGCDLSGVAANSWSVCFGKTFVSRVGMFADGFVTDGATYYRQLDPSYPV